MQCNSSMAASLLAGLSVTLKETRNSGHDPSHTAVTMGVNADHNA